MVASNVDLNIASLNDAIMLICTSGGGPNNTYQWEKDGTVLDGETSDTLTLVNVNASFGGNYTCTVGNTAGNESASIILHVAPYIVIPLEEQTLTTDGSYVNITCGADGFPSPTMSWVDMTNAEVVNTSLLEFSPVMFGDEGLYRCVATAEIDGTNFTAMDDTILAGMLAQINMYNTDSMYYLLMQFPQKVVLMYLHQILFPAKEVISHSYVVLWEALITLSNGK